MNVSARQRHVQAMMAPRGEAELAVTSLMRGIHKYVDLLERQGEAGSTDQQREFACVADLARATLTLSGGVPLGRLDGDLLHEELADLIARAKARSTVVPLSRPQPTEAGSLQHQHRRQAKPRPKPRRARRG